MTTTTPSTAIAASATATTTPTTIASTTTISLIISTIPTQRLLLPLVTSLVVSLSWKVLFNQQVPLAPVVFEASLPPNAVKDRRCRPATHGSFKNMSNRHAYIKGRTLRCSFLVTPPPPAPKHCALMLGNFFVARSSPGAEKEQKIFQLQMEQEQVGTVTTTTLDSRSRRIHCRVQAVAVVVLVLWCWWCGVDGVGGTVVTVVVSVVRRRSNAGVCFL